MTFRRKLSSPQAVLPGRDGPPVDMPLNGRKVTPSHRASGGSSAGLATAWTRKGGGDQKENFVVEFVILVASFLIVYT
jgi:hypothetical protein